MLSSVNPKVYIIILNWNGKNDTLECLSSVKKIVYPNVWTVVVDNGSSDGSDAAIRAAFPTIHTIQVGQNLGYAEGNNVGIRYAMEQEADYVFVLNNDTTVDPGVVTALVAEAEKNPNSTILGPKIYFYDRPDVINSAGGHIDYQTLERGHLGYDFKEDGLSFSTVAPVEWITGCALFFRVSALRHIGIFDADYFLICEELDLCTRVRKNGYDILFVPEAKIWHKVSAAFEGNFSAVYCYYIFRNVLLYVRKNFPAERFPLYLLLLKQSREFYNSLVQRGDPDYRKKGFCILMGNLHFFLGVVGDAPSWLFKINFPLKKPTPVSADHVTDLFKGEIRAGDSLITGKTGTTIHLPVVIKNLSEAVWPAFSSDAVHLSYHIRDIEGNTIVWDGQRSLLPRNLQRGKSVALDAVVLLPDTIGTYILEWDIVQETVAWFSKKGSSTQQTKLLVR